MGYRRREEKDEPWMLEWTDKLDEWKPNLLPMTYNSLRYAIRGRHGPRQGLEKFDTFEEAMAAIAGGDIKIHQLGSKGLSDMRVLLSLDNVPTTRDLRKERKMRLRIEMMMLIDEYLTDVEKIGR